jgi:hypothetical protein
MYSNKVKGSRSDANPFNKGSGTEEERVKGYDLGYGDVGPITSQGEVLGQTQGVELVILYTKLGGPCTAYVSDASDGTHFRTNDIYLKVR